MEDKKRVDLLRKKLAGTDMNAVAETINNLRNEKQFPGAINLLCELYDNTDNQTIKNVIASFMNDMKENASRSEVIGELTRPFKPETLAMLLSSCWQSGLDYSEYSVKFAMLFLNGTYQVALESYTLLEESAMNINPEMKEEVRDILISSRPAIRQDKMPLLQDLITLYS